MDGERVLSEALKAFRLALGDRLLGAYAMGSLAHGGFSELVSDVDLGLIISDPIQPDDAATIEAVADAEKAKGPDLRARLSVFWGTPSTLRGERPGGRFNALDRLDLLESGRLLAGCDDVRRDLPRPSVEELIVTGAEFALAYLAGARVPTEVGGDALGPMRFARAGSVRGAVSPDLVVDLGVRYVTKLVLFPVRFLFTAATGRVGTNGEAVDRYVDDRDAPSKELVAAAYAWRIGVPFDEATALELLGQQMVPLYTRYIDDHIPRLDSLHRDELADLFRDWRSRLTD
jgi:predicted nucleotidyltransferase